MQQFPVPQFIDVEDKILGPITTRQFVLMLAAGLVTFILYQLLTFIIFIVAGLLNLGMFAALAFVKVNGRPVHFFLLNILQTFKRPQRRIWNKAAYVRDIQIDKSHIKDTTIKKLRKEPITGSRLSDLTLVVNTGGVYAGEDIADRNMPTQ